METQQIVFSFVSMQQYIDIESLCNRKIIFFRLTGKRQDFRRFFLSGVFRFLTIFLHPTFSYHSRLKREVKRKNENP